MWLNRSGGVRLALFLCAFAAALLAAPGAQAQLREWQAYPSLREVRALDASADALWAATSGGVFSYRPAGGEIARYTPVEGLHAVEATTLTYDGLRSAVWIGYEDGVLDRLDTATGTVTAFFDIARADQYAERGVRRIRVRGDSLLVATAFGLVVFDVARAEVRDTYARLGTFEAGTAVNDALVAPLDDGRAGLWLATELGVVSAPLGSPNLQQPSAWTVEADAPRPATCLAFYDGRVHACAEGGAETRRAPGLWEQMLFTGTTARDLLATGGSLYAPVDDQLARIVAGLGGRNYDVTGYNRLVAVAAGPDGSLWLGDGERGLVRLPPLGDELGGTVTVEPAQSVLPAGPYSNVVRDVAVGEGGVLWVSHARDFIETAVSRLDGTGWLVLVGNDDVEGDADLPRATLVSAEVGPDGTFYAASDGGGLAVVTPDGVAKTYTNTNSTLLLAPGTTRTVTLGDAVPDAAGRLWVTNRFVARPLHIFLPEEGAPGEGTWTSLPFPPGLPTTVNLNRIVFDDFGQIWTDVRSNTSNQGLGMAVIAPGADPLNPADDQGRYFNQVGTDGTGLPSEEVRALAFDREGRLWIGTRRGLAIIFSPGAALGGDPSLAQPVWARTADGASYLLRDLWVNDIALDPSGQLWLASTTGAWLLNADGTEVLLNLTTDNAPLLSNNVVAVEVDPASGRVYFATDRGLQSALGEATAPAAESRDLDVSPSPYLPAEHARGVLISGLVAETTVYVLTPDGQRVAALDARGGSVRWDGRDERTGEPASSGVYLVAAVAASGEPTAHGKVAVIR